MIRLKFTPLEFETANDVPIAKNKALKFTPLEFETGTQSGI